jgi:hypothetical protein
MTDSMDQKWSAAERPWRVIVATSQLGYRPASPKTVSLLLKGPGELPDEIPFFIQRFGDRRARVQPGKPREWTDELFRWPFDIMDGTLTEDGENYGSFWSPRPLGEGLLRRVDSRWGPVWQADFTDFADKGTFQVETQYNFSTPFVIDDDPYQRLLRGYLIYLYSQRSGFEVPGIRPAENADDAVLDRDGTPIPASGGWNDAGDTRKWLFLTFHNLEALAQVARVGHPAFRQPAIDEIAWGNRYYQSMINEAGQVYEDVGGGPMRPGQVYEKDWWCENHPGVSALGEPVSDNVPGTGDERKVRTHYAPLPQFQFVRYQALTSAVTPPHESTRALILAERAWRYGQEKGHDGRTLFVAEELLAGLELVAAGSRTVSARRLREIAEGVFSRQDTGSEGLSHYFLEKDETDGFRSLAFSCEPALALLRLFELQPEGLVDLADRAGEAVTAHIDRYLLADAKSNPFGVTPYGVYVTPERPDLQSFRPAGRGRTVRTWLQPFNSLQMPHGCGGVTLAQAYLLARAGQALGRSDWQAHAERLLQWSMGHNPEGLCLFTGVGFHHPVPGSFLNYKVPEAVAVGFIGRPDDTPYLETSNAVEWSTQEIWDVPYFYAVGAIAYLKPLAPGETK